MRPVLVAMVVVVGLEGQGAGDAADGQPELLVPVAQGAQWAALVVGDIPARGLERVDLRLDGLGVDAVPIGGARRALGFVGGEPEHLSGALVQFGMFGAGLGLGEFALHHRLELELGDAGQFDEFSELGGHPHGLARMAGKSIGRCRNAGRLCVLRA